MQARINAAEDDDAADDAKIAALQQKVGEWEHIEWHGWIRAPLGTGDVLGE